MLLHVADAVQSGFKRVIVCTVDTDVLVLAVAFAQQLEMLTEGTIKLWIAFGTGANLHCSTRCCTLIYERCCPCVTRLPRFHRLRHHVMLLWKVKEGSA